jgi:adenylate cyclase
MEAQEMRTLAALKGDRDALIDPRIANHYGRIVKLIGDETRVEFASLFDAVQLLPAVNTIGVRCSRSMLVRGY